MFSMSNGYRLIDCGNGKKLEQFGDYRLIRPDILCPWKPALPLARWEAMADADFEETGPKTGKWVKRSQALPEAWEMRSDLEGFSLNFELKLTGFKHVGVFPEQSQNWQEIYEFCNTLQYEPPRVLNLFAYTGGASLAARAAGACVTHVDAVKQVITWARRNMELSGLSDIRWIAEDALSFASREARRKKDYHVIVLDPPAYGVGTGGRTWKLERDLLKMMSVCKDILNPERYLLILNTYSPAVQAVDLKEIFHGMFGGKTSVTISDLCLSDSHGHVIFTGLVTKASSPT
jgi:23S rRNA (cytosine1962-C5)-methyltransferase